jgi:twitching motility protein PilT
MHADDDLDRLVSELHRGADEAPAREAPSHTLLQWLRLVRQEGGSDLLLVAGSKPIVRLRGDLTPAADTVLDGDDVLAAVSPMLPQSLLTRFRAGEAVDAAFGLPQLGRFRINLHRERGRPAAAIRALPLRIPQLRDLRFSHDIGRLATLPRGLVLICGPTGSGKTTTLAALVAAINANQSRHIITIEDPVEYEHRHERSLIEQIEIGIDAADFPTALRAAVRQAPDVIVVGELRDPETMRIAVNAAETGHLVLATLHATDASAAVSRICDAFPTERQNAVRQELAMALAAVLTQALVTTTSGSVVVPIAELLFVSYGARQHIRKNALQHLHQEITITRKSGSFTFEESLADLVAKGLLERKEARLRAPHPEDFDSIVGSAGP